MCGGWPVCTDQSALRTGRSRRHIAHRADTVAVGFLRPDGLATVTGRSLDQSGGRSAIVCSRVIAASRSRRGCRQTVREGWHLDGPR